MKKRSVVIAGHATSLTLEEPFWRALKAAARREGTTVNGLVERIDAERTAAGEINLSSAVRVWLFERARAAAGSAEKTRQG
jgi:predicted DNA-binding ribbon-helix-helix protein